jgi:6-phosphofructokinase 1
MRIAILTGGGDVPGLNPCIKAIALGAARHGWEVVGFRRGWAGPLECDIANGSTNDHLLMALTPERVRTIDRTGGTVPHSSRTNPAKVKAKDLPAFLKGGVGLKETGGLFDATPHILRVLDVLKIDALVAIGGDDTLGFAQRLGSEHVPLVAIPKTMDNDVQGTEYCIGFSTAVTRAKELINRQRTTLGSHERIGVFRIFGRNSGYTAWYAAYVTSARCVIPEAPFDLEQLASVLAEDRELNPSHYAFVIASEGALWRGRELEEFGEADAYGHRRKADVGLALATELRRLTGIEAVNSDLTYDLRSGDPDAVDQMVATTFANDAMDLLAEGRVGRMSAIQDGKYAHAPLPDASLGPRKVDIASMYNAGRFRPTYAHKHGLPLMLGDALGS